MTRKTPVVPPPPTSRTSSSQPTPRTAKGKTRAAPSTLTVGDDLGEPGYGPSNSSSGEGGPNDVVSETNSCDVRHWCIVARDGLLASSVVLQLHAL